MGFPRLLYVYFGPVLTGLIAVKFRKAKKKKKKKKKKIFFL